MKKTLFILLAMMLAFGLAACGSPETALSPSLETTAETPGIVAFADPVLEASVRFSILGDVAGRA